MKNTAGYDVLQLHKGPGVLVLSISMATKKRISTL